jgi:hypothetical protein
VAIWVEIDGEAQVIVKGPSHLGAKMWRVLRRRGQGFKYTTVTNPHEPRGPAATLLIISRKDSAADWSKVGSALRAGHVRLVDWQVDKDVRPRI